MNEYAPFDMPPQFGAGRGSSNTRSFGEGVVPHVDAFPGPGGRLLPRSLRAVLWGLYFCICARQLSPCCGWCWIFSPAFWVNPGIYQTLQAGQRHLRSPVFPMRAMRKAKHGIRFAESCIDTGKAGFGNIRVQIEREAGYSEASWRSVLPAFLTGYCGAKN